MYTPVVRISDVAEVIAEDEALKEKIDQMELYRFSENKADRYVISSLQIIEIIWQGLPGSDVTQIGPPDVLIYFTPGKDKSGTTGKLTGMDYFKIICVCGICFFGTAFSIMAFHNDIGIQGVFDRIYEGVGLSRSNDFPMLEIGYSVGLAVGIIVFYNHIGKRRITHDPTPVEVEMQIYEDDVNNTLIEEANKLKRGQ